MHRRLRLAFLCFLTLLPSVAAQQAGAWRDPSNFENRAAHIISAADAQASREPDVAVADDGGLVAAWSDQFAMEFGRSFNGQFPEFSTWTVSTIAGSSVPTGTANDTSKPSIAVRGTKVAVAYLFNFDRTGSPGQQHDVILATGQLTASGTGVSWDTAFPTRITFSDTDNAKRVSVAIDQGGNVELAWEDDPDSSTSDVIRYLEVGSGRPTIDLSDSGGTATWPVLAVDGANRLHIVYTQNGQVVERFAEQPASGQARLFGNPTLSVGSSAQKPDLAILPNGSGPGTPIVVYDDAAACGKRQVFAAAPGIGPTQLSDCTLTANQTQATIAVRASDRTVYAAWVRETKGTAPTGPFGTSRMQASVGWRWWAPIEVVPTDGGGGFFGPQMATTASGEQVISEMLTGTAPSGQEIVHVTNTQLPSDVTGMTATARTGGPGIHLTWDPPPAPSDDYAAIKVIRKPANDFAGPNDPAATVIGTLYTDIQVINGHYQVVTPLPTSIDDPTADPTKSYVYAAYVSHRGPTPLTNFNQSPGYRFGAFVNYGSPPAATPPPAVPGAPAFEIGTPVVRSFTADAQDGVVNLAWTNPGLFDQIQLVRKAGSAPTSPTDGTLLLTSATATAYTDGAVTNGVTYYYSIWVSKGGQLSSPTTAIGTPNPPNAPFTYIAQPAGSFSGTGGIYTLGAVFHVTTAKAILKLGRAYAPGSFAGNQIGVWDDATGTLLASATVSPLTPTAALPVPLVLTPGTRYVIGVKEENGSMWSPARVLVGMPSYLVIDDSAFVPSSTLAFPSQRDGKPGQSNEDWQMTLGPPDSLPLTAPAPVTGLTALPGNARVDLAWTNPADFDNVQVVRKVGGLPANPSDGTVVYTGTGTSFTDTAVTNGTAYFYAAWSVRRGEIAQAPATATTTPNLPAGAVTYTTTPVGSYTPPGYTYVAGTVFHVTSDQLLLQLGRVYQSGSIVGNKVGIWDATTQALVYSGTVTPTSPTLVLTSPVLLTAGKQYVLGFQEAAGTPWSPARKLVGLPSFLAIDDSAFFAGTTFSYPSGRDSKPGFSNEDWTMTFGTPGGLPVSSLRAVADDGAIGVSWSNPSDVGLVKVVRKVGSAPTSPTDGTVVYNASGDGFFDTGLTNGTTYWYGAWIQRSGGISAVALASATPAAQPVDPVKGLKANAGDGRVDLFWTNPGPTSMAVIGDSVSTGGSIDQAGIDKFSSSWAGGADPADGFTSHYEKLLAANPAIAGNVVNYAHSGSPMSDMLIEADAAVGSGTPYDYVTFMAGSNDVCGPSDTPMTDPDVFRAQFRLALAKLNLGLPGARILVTSIPDWTRLWTLFGTNTVAKTAWFDNGRCPRVLANGVTDSDRASIRQRIVQLNQILMEECAVATSCRYDMGAVFNWQFTPADISSHDYFHPSAAGQGHLADLTWAAGFWPDLAGQQIQVVRKTGSAPTSPTDGTVVYSGAANTAADTAVVNDTTYTYGVFVTRGGRTSSGAIVSSRPSTIVSYTAQPAGDFSRTDALWNIGTVFHVTAAKTLLELGRAYAPGSTASNQVGIWDAGTGVLLASATVDPLNPVAALATPLALQAGKSYVISVKESVGSPWSATPRALTGLPPFLSIDDTSFNNSASFSFPSFRDNQSPPVRIAEDWTMAFGPPGTAPVVLPTPVSALQAVPADRSVALSWTNPTSPFDQIQVVRRTGAAPVSPNDGTIVYSGVDSAFTDTGLVNGQQYGYGVWSVRGGQLSAARVVLTTPTGLVPDPVTALQASPGDRSVALSWTNPTSAFDAVKVVRKAGTAPANPSDGTVVYSGTGTSVSDTGLVNGTLYYYAVWVQRGSNVSSAFRLAATPNIGPVAAVTNLQATPGDARADLSWTNPTSPFDRVHVVRKAGSAPASLTDGVEIYSGTAATAADTGLTNGTLYFYAVWVEKSGLLSSPVRASAQPGVPAPAPITNLAAAASDRRVDLSWTNPAGAFDTITVVRKIGAAPADPSDGTVIFQGNASSVADAGLTNGTAYFYAVWVQRGTLLSPVVRVTGIPLSASDVTAYAAAPTGAYSGVAANYTLGMVFHVTQDKAVLTLGRLYAPGSTAGNQIGIWDEASGVLLYSTTVTPAAPSTTLANPLILRSDKRYVLGVKESVGTPWSSQRPLTGLPSFLVADDTAYIQNSLFTNPTQRDGKPGQSNEDWTMTFGSVASAPNTPDPPTNLVALPGDTQASLSWTNPSTPFDQVEIVRKTGSMPTDPSDGTLVYAGTGSSATSDSAASAVVAALAPPASATVPAVAGTAQQGQSLSSDLGSWTNGPTGFARVWRRCDAAGANCSDISGATAPSYTLGIADVGSTLRARVTATNSAGSGTADSAASAVVTAILPPASLGAPTVTPALTSTGACVSGCTITGRTLTSDPGTWSRGPTGFVRDWRRCDSAGATCGSIPGADGTSYTLAPADAGSTIRIRVTASNSAGSTSADSPASALVTAPAQPNLSPDPTFEADPLLNSWTTNGTGTFTWATDASHSGTHSLKLVTSQASGLVARWMTQVSSIPVTADHDYGASVWLKTSGVADYALLSLSFWSNGVYSGVTTDSTRVTGTQDWTQVSQQVTAPAGATAVRFEIRLSGPGTLWADDVSTIDGTLAPAAPSNATLPAVTGTAQQGQTLSADNGAWNPSSVIYGYQWRRCATTGLNCVDIPGATSPSYVVDAADIGSTVRVRVTATANRGGAGFVDSAASATVVPMAVPASLTVPALSGTPQQGQSLSSDTGGWTGGPTSFVRQWQRCDAGGANCVDVGGQSGASYALSAADVGTTVRVRVTASNAAGSASADSATSAIVNASGSGGGGGAPAPPVLSGTAQQGQTLTADTGTFAGSPTSFARQWLRCDAAGGTCTPILGQTGPAYTLTAADVGKTIRVRVTAAYPNGFASDVGLTNGVQYFYSIWSFRGGLFSVPVRATTTPANGAPQPVANLAALPGDGLVVLSWTNPTGTFDAVKIVRKTGSPPTGPTDGTPIYSGTASTTTDLGLTNGTIYYYGVWVTRGGLFSTAAQASTTPSAAALDPVTGLTATPSDSEVDLAWTNPTTAFDQVLIVRKAGTVTPIAPTDGVAIYGGTGVTAADTGAVNGTTYTYAVWVMRSGQLSAPLTVTATPVASLLTPVTNLVATAGNTTVALSWTNPTTHFDRVHVIRKVGSAPTGLADGTEIYASTGNSVSDTALTNGVTYFYGVWVDRAGALSTAVQTSATPVDPSADTVYTSTPVGVYGGTAPGYNLGGVFHVTQDKLLRKVGRVYKDGSTAGNQIGIYDAANGALLASAAVTPAAPLATLATPLPLTAGKQYVIGIKEATGSPWSVGRLLTALPSFLVIDDTAYNVSNTFSYPNLRDGKPGWANDDWIMSFAALGPPPPPDPATALQATAGDARADLTWTNPTTAFDQVQVVRKAGSAPANPADGTTVFTGTAAAFADTGLTNGTTYFYSVWTQHLGVYSATAAQTTAAPSPPPPDPATAASASAGDASVALSWTNPTTPFDLVRVVRKAGSPPADPTDGTQVFSGIATAFSDTGLTNGVTYHYGIWTQRSGKLGPPARTSATPSSIVTYSLQPTGDYARTDGGWNIGTVFHVTQDKALLKIGRSYGPGSTAPNRIGVFDDATGTLLASATVSPASPTAALATPVALLAGHRYAIAVGEVVGSRWSGARAIANLPAFLVVDDSSYDPSGTFGFPSQYDNQTAPVKLAEDWTMTFAPPGTPALTLPDPVTALTAAPGDARVDLAWTNPTTPFTEVDVVRKVGSAPVSPSDGTQVYSGVGTSFADTGLTNGTLTFYGVWVKRSTDQSSEVVASATPSGLNPDPVTNLLAVAGDAKVDLSWTNPTSQFDAVKVVRKAGSAPANPTDGTTVFTGTGVSFSDTGVTNGTLYFYAVWVQRGANVSAATRVAATPAAVPIDPVTNLVATPGNGQVSLSWTSPTSFDTIQVVRKAGSAPVDPTDGITVFNGTGSLTLDTGLTNGTAYQYAVWVIRGGSLSAPVRTVATPDTPPPDPVTGLVAASGDGQAVLSWTNPTTAFDLVKVVRNAAAPPTGPADGTTIYSGTGTTVTDTGLTNTAVYYYGVWVVRGTGVSSVMRASAVPQPAAAVDTVTMQPTGDYAMTAASYNIGMVFHVTQDKALLQLGRVYNPGSTGGNQIGVWDEATGALLASVSVTPAAPVATLANAIVLRAGKRYVQGIKESVGSPWSRSRVATGLPSYLVIDDSAYSEGSFGNPTLRDNQTAPVKLAEDWTMVFGSVAPPPPSPDPVTGLQATISDGRVDLTWTNPASAFDQIEVVRKLGGTPTDPTDGTIVYTGVGTAAADVGLVNGTQVNYAVWTIRSGQLSTPATIAATPLAVPPGPVTNVVANPGDAQVTLTWTNPIGAIDAIKVVRKVGGAPATPTDGTVVYGGTGTTAVDTGLTNGTLYQYAIWVARGSQLSTVTRTSATPVAAPLDPVASLQATPGDLRVDLSWTNPATPFDQITVVRKIGSDPGTPTDGIVAFSGTATSLADTGLANGSAYHYAIWAQRSGLLSAPVRVTVTPVAPPLVTVTGLSATAGNSRVDLSWTNPTIRFDRVVVVRKGGSAPTGETDGAVVYSGTATSAADTVLSNGTTYFYGVWVERDTEVSAPARAQATPLDPASVVSYTSTPTGAYGGQTGSFTAGAVFHVTDPKVLLSLGRVFKAGSTGSNQIGIWDEATTALLGSVTVTQAQQSAQLATPIVLQAGKRYVIGVNETTGNPWSLARLLTSLPGFLVIDDTAFDTSASFAYPAGRDNKPGQSNDDWTMSFGAVGTVTAPGPVTALQSTWNNGRVDLTWTNPAGPFDQVKIVRKPGSAPADPSDGTVVYGGTGTSLSDTGLTNGTLYHYAVWVGRGGVFSTVARTSATPNVPVDNVTALVAAPGDLRVDLSWTNPTTAFDEVRIVRKTGGAPADPADGTVVYSGTGTSFADTAVANGTAYSYAVWVVRSGLFSFTATRATATPVAPPLLTVTGLQATPGNGRVDLAWTNPSFRFDAVVVVRKVDADPADQTDGTVVYNGTGASLADTGLANGTGYRYAAFVFRDGAYSSAARTGATPYDAASQLAYTASPTGGYTGTGAFTVGAVFHLTDTKLVLSLGRVFKAGSTGSNQIGIWDDTTTTLLGTVTVTNAQPTGTLATPIVLQSGKRYVIGVRETTGNPWSTARTLTNLPGFLVIDDTAYDTGATFAYPAGRDGKPGQSNEDWTIGFAAVGTVTAPSPATALAAVPGDAKATLSWTAPSPGPYDQVKLVRKAGADPASPSDGTLVYSGTATSLVDTGLTNATDYRYALWAVRGGVLSTVARVAVTPLGQTVSNLVAAPGDLRVDLTWTNPPTAFDQIQIVRKAGSPPASPADGSQVYLGTGTSAADTGIANGTTYHYAVWALRSGQLSFVARASATPVAPPLVPVTGLQGVAGNARVDLSWTNPTIRFDAIQVVRKQGGIPASATDGTTVFTGTATSLADTGLTNGFTYGYAVYVSRDGALSTAATLSALPFDANGVVTYTAQPTGAYNGTAAALNLGGVFHVTVPKALTSIGRAYKAGSTAGNQIGIWDEATGGLLASVNVTPASPVATLPTPLQLQAGKRYVIGVKESTGSPWSGARTLTGLPGFLVIDDTAYNTSTTFSNPNLRDAKPGQSNEDWTLGFAAVGATIVPDPVTALAATAGDGKATLAWTNPTTPYDVVQVVRKLTTDPTGPADGTVVYTGTAATFLDTGLVNGTSYHYGVYVLAGGVPSSGAFATVIPSVPGVTAFVAAAGDGKVTLTWTNPTIAFDQVKVVRKLGADPANPTDGTPVYTGTGTSVVDTGLVNGTNYRYAVWITRGAELSQPVRASATPAFATPDPVTAFQALPGDLKVDLSWTNPTTLFDQLKVVRKLGADPANPTDGTTVYTGTGTSFSDTGLVNGTNYRYAVWTFRGTQTSTPVRASVTPSGAVLTPVTGVSATAGSGSVALAWTNPTVRFDQVVVVRKSGADPADPTDGTTVYAGTATSASDTGLTNGTTYHYAIWSQRDGASVGPVRVNATPIDPATIVGYTLPTGSYSNTAPDYTLGGVFHVTADRLLVRLGRAYAAGSTAGNRIGIWEESTATLLAAVDVTPSSPTVVLDTPLQLQAGKRYVIGVKEASGTPWSAARVASGLPSFLVIDDTAWIAGATFTYPGSRDAKPGQSNEDWTMSFAPVQAAPAAPTAPAAVTGLAASPGNARVDLTWTNPAGGFDQIEVVRKAGSPPADPTDGTVVASGAAITSAADTGLTNGTVYHYAVWALNGALLSPPTRASTTPTAPPAPVTALTATPGATRVDLTWTNPAGGFDQIEVVRKAGSPPADPTDGTLIASGATIAAVADTGLTNGVTYHYAVWALSGALLSAPTRVSATPAGP